MSELLFLGTGAADWKIEDRNGFFRRNSAAMVNNDLMLDCGPHIFDFAECAGNPKLYDGVTDILLTHDHDDHVCYESIRKLADEQKIRVGCDKYLAESIGEHENIEYVIFMPYETRKMGKYTVTQVLANHYIVQDGRILAYHYIIETEDGKTLFYGLDGAWFIRSTWETMKQHKFDVMVFDCTVGDRDDWRFFEHNTIPMLRMMLLRINDQNMVKENGKLIASHLARTLHASHEETAEILNQMNMLTAYDGMKIEF